MKISNLSFHMLFHFSSAQNAFISDWNVSDNTNLKVHLLVFAKLTHNQQSFWKVRSIELEVLVNIRLGKFTARVHLTLCYQFRLAIFQSILQYYRINLPSASHIVLSLYRFVWCGRVEYSSLDTNRKGQVKMSCSNALFTNLVLLKRFWNMHMP